MTLSDEDVDRIANRLADVLEERKEQRRVDQARLGTCREEGGRHTFFETGHGRRCIDCGRWAG